MVFCYSRFLKGNFVIQKFVVFVYFIYSFEPGNTENLIKMEYNFLKIVGLVSGFERIVNFFTFLCEVEFL